MVVGGSSSPRVPSVLEVPSTPTHRGSPAAPQETEADHSLTGRIKRFAGRILKKATSPLLQLKIQESPSPKLPLRSRHIAAQPLSKVPVSKRGEILAMQRLRFIQGAPTEEGRQSYEGMYFGNLEPSHREAVRVLFPDDEQPVRPRKHRGGREFTCSIRE